VFRIVQSNIYVPPGPINDVCNIRNQICLVNVAR